MANPYNSRGSSSSRTPSQPQKTKQAEQQQGPAQELPPTAGVKEDQQLAVYRLPAEVERRGISEDQWLVMRKSLYPGALPESVVMVWDYCKARKLDPLKKPVHIVPMEVTVKTRLEDGKILEHKEWRDVVMPGIYEYRTTAMRTGLYCGHSEPIYGDPEEQLGVMAPLWCSMIMFRWNEKAGRVTEFPVKVFFKEIASTKWHPNLQGVRICNAKWTQSPVQMLTKCTEAAGLREAFPDELGGEHTMEEMEGKTISFDDETPQQRSRPATHTQAAKDALRQRQGTTIEGAATRRQEQPSSAPSTSQEVPERQELDDEFAMGPQDERAANQQQQTPQKREPDKNKNEYWTKLFGEAPTEEALDAIWDDCLAWHDEHKKEVDISVEAVYGIKKERYEEARKQ